MTHGSGKSGRKILLIVWASCNLTESLWSGPTSWATYVYLHSRIRTSSSHASLFSTLQKDPHSLAQSLSRSLGRRKLGTHHRAPEALPALSLHISSSTWAPRIQSPAQQWKKLCLCERFSCKWRYFRDEWGSNKVSHLQTLNDIDFTLWYIWTW